MLYQIIKIDFDFESDDANEPLDVCNQSIITNKMIGEIWEADDEDDLVEEITCATGWLINSIDYRMV